MAKGDRKVQNEDESSEIDSEFESPSYDELMNLLNKYSKIIRKTRGENEKLENENESLHAKLNSRNEIMTTKLKDLKLSLKELKEKHDKLESVHDELITRHRVLKEEFTTLKVNNDNLELAYDPAINETHVATNHVAKLDVATSCDDLLVESIGKCGNCKGKNVVVAKSYDNTIKIMQENQKIKCENVKLNKELQEQEKHNIIVVETFDHDKDLAYENKKLKEENQYLKLGLLYGKQEEDESFMLEELDSKNDPIIKRLTKDNKKLKLEKEHLTKGLAKFTRGKDLQIELFMNTIMKMDNCGIGYKAQQSKLIKSHATHDQPSKPNPKIFFECGQEGHFAYECEAPLPPPLPKHARPFAFNAHYIVRQDKSGKVKVSFIGPPNKQRPKKIWVPKSLVEKVKGPKQMWVSKTQAWPLFANLNPHWLE